MIAFFRGKIALALKVIVLALIAALLLSLAESAIARHEWAIGGFLVLSVLVILFAYLTKKSIPLKFFVPGLLLLFAFVLSPIIYTVAMSGFTYKTGNILSKEQAQQQITLNATAPDANGTAFDIKLGTAGGKPAILASDSVAKKYFLSTVDARTDFTPDQVTLNADGVATGAPGFTALTNDQLSGADKTYSTLQFKYQVSGPFFIKTEGLDAGVVDQTTLKYDASTDTYKSLVDNSVYKDNGKGNYAQVGNPTNILLPGWRAPIWFENYTKLFTDHRIRGQLISVFIWTVIFAASSVLTTFALGLLLAIALNKPMRGRRIYRSILVLPYAMPSIMSILIWGGMFDTQFGAINNLLGTQIAWFSSANLARLAVILVNLWLGFPYFYLVSSGALQAIPAELSEAAAIDGANPRQIFRRITLPLLLQILSPLLISSFAFNFNNFNMIYLLTGGGPTKVLDGQIAGATDILISYTYKIAFSSGTQDFGLASAISLVIFLLVASISMYGLRKSKVLESFG